MAFCLYVAVFRQFLAGVRIAVGCGADGRVEEKAAQGWLWGDFGLKLMSGLGLVKIFAVKIP